MVNDKNRKELKRLLYTDIPDISGENLYVWGTGNTAALYREGLQRLEKEGFAVSGYCDNDPAKWGG